MHDLDTVVVGGGVAALLLLAFIRHLARNPTDKVVRRPAPGGLTLEAPAPRRGVLARIGLRKGGAR